MVDYIKHEEVWHNTIENLFYHKIPLSSNAGHATKGVQRLHCLHFTFLSHRVTVRSVPGVESSHPVAWQAQCPLCVCMCRGAVMIYGLWYESSYTCHWRQMEPDWGADGQGRVGGLWL